MICNNCGARVSKNSSFCNKCGIAMVKPLEDTSNSALKRFFLSQFTEQIRDPLSPIEANVRVLSQRGKTVIAIFIAIILFVLPAIILTFFTM
ncbi:MAG: zinc-ribbon domain-containing protein [Oscillospiraceae bacterium]|nr:zinc-ribbon domain-containing protein [Oscillospiraceae bacterium]